MGKFTDIAELKYSCDECKKTFFGKEIVLKKATTNMHMQKFFGYQFVFVDKDGRITGGSAGPDGSIGDQVAHCPKCDYPHLFGFNQCEEKR